MIRKVGRGANYNRNAKYYKKARSDYYNLKRMNWRTTFRRGVVRNNKYSINHVHKFKRSVDVAPIEITDASVGHSFSFKLNDVPNFGEFTGLYDQYRISGVAIRFFFTRNNVSVNGTAGGVGTVNPNWRLVHLFDRDDSTTLLSLNSALEFQNCKIVSSTLLENGYRIFIRPYALNPIYRSGVTFGYGTNPRKQWLDCANDDILHYALKLWIDSTIDSTAGKFGDLRMIFTYYLDFRTVR